jgi:hypothetical protein
MKIITQLLYDNFNFTRASCTLYLRIVLSVKDGVAFVMTRIGVISIIAFVTRVNMARISVMAVHPLLFLTEQRNPNLHELNEMWTILGFIQGGFQDHRSVAEILHLINRTLAYKHQYELTRDDLIYIINFGIKHHQLNVNTIPQELVPDLDFSSIQDASEDVPPSTKHGSNSGSDSGSDSDGSMEVSTDIYQFFIDHSVKLVIAFGIICIGVLLYIFKSRGPSNPGKDVTNDPAKDPAKGTTNSSVVKYIVTVYASWILFIRSFFIKEHPWLIPLLLLLAHMNLYYQIWPIFDLTFIMRFFLWLGMYCLAIDSLGSLISTYALSGTSNLFDQVLPLLTKKHSNIILEYYCSISVTALIIGKTAMTATGRAALGVGLISGAGYLINAQLDRQHQAEQNKQARDFTAQEAQRQRDSTAQEAQRQRDYTTQQAQKQRDSIAQEAQRQRDFATQEAQKQREWQDQKDRQQAYESSWYPFKKKPPK